MLRVHLRPQRRDHRYLQVPKLEFDFSVQRIIRNKGKVAAAGVFVKSLGHKTTEIVTGATPIEPLLGSESSVSDINVNSAHTVEDYGDDISSRP